MFKRNAKGNTRTKLVTGAVMLVLGLSAAGTAMSTDTFGGGATLPAGGYVGFNFLNPAVKQSANTAFPTSGAAAVSSTSLFGAWAARTGNKVSYCQTGSGNGKKIFDNSDGTNHLTAIGACDGTTIGFGAPSSILVNPHFAGSDAPMSATEYNWFDVTGGKKTQYGEPVQFPAVAGSIAVIYRKDSLSTPLNLTSAQVCGVFNGSITQWSALTGNASDTTTIKVAFRSDGSGTSFSLANHMATACVGTECDLDRRRVARHGDQPIPIDHPDRLGWRQRQRGSHRCGRKCRWHDRLRRIGQSEGGSFHRAARQVRHGRR